MADDIFTKENIKAFLLFVILLFLAVILKDAIVRSWNNLQKGDWIGALIVGFLAYLIWYIFFRRKNR